MKGSGIAMRAALAAAAFMGMPLPMPESPRGVRLRHRSAAVHGDPFHGIKSKGRTGARARAAQMAGALSKAEARKRHSPTNPGDKARIARLAREARRAGA